jgi:hypothetical protein
MSHGRIWEDLAGRLTGPMQFRLFLQPAMATIFAIRDGIRDACNGEPAYFWSLFTDPMHRCQRIRAGWKAVWRVFTLAVAMDIIYQLIATHGIYPGETLLVAASLAILPYIVLRGPINRMIRYCTHRSSMSRLYSRICGQDCPEPLPGARFCDAPKSQKQKTKTSL